MKSAQAPKMVYSNALSLEIVKDKDGKGKMTQKVEEILQKQCFKKRGGENIRKLENKYTVIGVPKKEIGGKKWR